ncbi:MAG: hypothetical protein IPG53_16285 [Ignavibacteriales bacterium]|nr:hypothetical protein [Ignavibacteriales bacterium]
MLAYIAPRILELNEVREGFSFVDPVLNLFSPVDLTWWIFLMLYSGLFLTFYYISDKPVRFMMGFQAYFFLLSSRLIAMTLLPLKAPETLIPLFDPFISSLSSGIVLKHDLFFSGHISVAVLLAYIVENKKMRYILWALAVFMSIFILLQHVHYTIDIFVAPFFSFAIWRSIEVFNKKLGFTPET